MKTNTSLKMNRGCLQIFEKNSAIMEKILHFENYVLTVKNDKINTNLAYLDD
jgi:hypothetical protein